MRPRKKISQKDIAKALGISNVSVSNALAGRKGVSVELTAKVRQAAAEMGYDAGQEGAGKAAGTVLIVTSESPADGRDGWIAEIVRKQKVQAQFCSLMEVLDGTEAEKPSNAPKNPAGLGSRTGNTKGRAKGRKLQIAGCLGLLVPERIASEELAALKAVSEENGRKPLVGIGFFDSRVPIDYVLDDGFHGAQEVVRYLSDRGCENILYVRPDENSPALGGMEPYSGRNGFALDETGQDDLSSAIPPGRDSELSGGSGVSNAVLSGKNSVSDAVRRMRMDCLLGYRSGMYLRDLHRVQNIKQAEAFELGDESRILDLPGAEAYIREWDRAGKRRGYVQGNRSDERTAFFCGDMDTARRLTAFLLERGIKVPDEIAVACYCVHKKEGSLPVAGKKITAVRSLEEHLWEKGCEIIWERVRTGKTTEGIHLVKGEVLEGDTV